MANTIVIDTQLLEDLSRQIMQVKNSLSGISGNVTSSLSEVRRVAPDQPAIIDKLLRAKNNLSTMINHTQKLSKAVGDAAVLWAQAEQKVTGQYMPESEIDSEEEARKKREEQAKWFKIGVGAACVIGSIAVVIATGGAALPVVIAGAATGAITAGSFNAADQYAEKGWDNIDWGSAGKDAVIGGIVGGVTSAISIGGGAVAQQVVNKATGTVVSTTANAATRLVTHTAGGAAAGVATGIVSRGGGEVVNEVLTNGEVNWDQVRDRAFDPKSMAVDGTMGGITGFRQGLKYNQQVAYREQNGDIVRNESYLQKNPYKKNYGGVDWEHQAPNNGRSGDIIHNYEIPEGTLLRRYGSEKGGNLRGFYDSFDSASLPYKQNAQNEHLYEVVKPIRGVTKSTAAPAFDMPGGATQYELPSDLNVKYFVDAKLLRRIY